MSLSRSDIRKLLEYEFLRHTSASEAAKQINEAHGAGTVSRSSAFEWFSKFQRGDLIVHDQKRSGRPKTIDRTSVVNAIEEDPTMNLRDLAAQFDCSHVAIQKILRAEGKKWMKGRWVPHDLTAGQKQKRVDCC